MTTISKTISRQNVGAVLVGILVLGSIWGMSEVVLGGGLRTVNFPYSSGLLTGIGLGLMGVALAVYRKPAMLLGIGAIGVLVKFLVVPVLHVSVMCKANSALGVMMDAAALTAVAAMVQTTMNRSIHARMGYGAVAALAAAVGFYFIGNRLAPCPYLLSFSPAGFMITEGLIWAAFSAGLLSLGYVIGERLTDALPRLSTSTVPYYAVSSAVVVIAWVASAVAIAAGW